MIFHQVLYTQPGASSPTATSIQLCTFAQPEAFYAQVLGQHGASSIHAEVSSDQSGTYSAQLRAFTSMMSFHLPTMMLTLPSIGLLPSMLRYLQTIMGVSLPSLRFFVQLKAFSTHAELTEYGVSCMHSQAIFV